MTGAIAQSIPVTKELFLNVIFDPDERHIYAEKITEGNFLNLLNEVAGLPFQISTHERYVGIVSPRMNPEEERELRRIAKYFGYYVYIGRMSKRHNHFDIKFLDIAVLKKPEASVA